jgi:hypothetical protein
MQELAMEAAGAFIFIVFERILGLLCHCHSLAGKRSNHQ